MRRRKIVVVGVISLTMAFALAAACSFPDVEFGAGATEGGAGEAGDEGTAGEGAADGGADTRPVIDGGPPLVDATVEKPDVGTCVSACDCDGDKALSKDAGCGGKDCDDEDFRAFPGQNFLTAQANDDTKGDWNCDGNPERLHDVLGPTPCNGLGGAACDRIRGLVSDIPCGTFGEYIQCGANGLNLCVKVDGGVAQQECR